MADVGQGHRDMLELISERIGTMESHMREDVSKLSESLSEVKTEMRVEMERVRSEIRALHDAGEKVDGLEDRVNVLEARLNESEGLNHKHSVYWRIVISILGFLASTGGIVALFEVLYGE